MLRAILFCNDENTLKILQILKELYPKGEYIPSPEKPHGNWICMPETNSQYIKVVTFLYKSIAINRNPEDCYEILLLETPIQKLKTIKYLIERR